MREFLPVFLCGCTRVCFCDTVLLPVSLLSSSWNSASWSSISLTRASAFSLSIRSWVSLRGKEDTHTHYWMIWIQMTMAHLFVLWISYSKCLFHYIVQSVCLKTKWACHAPLPIMTTKTHRKWYPACSFLHLCVSACLSVCMLFCAHSDCVSFNSFIFRSNISWSCRFSSRQDSSSAFSAGSELLAESYTRADMMNKWEQWNIRHQVVLVA